MQKGVWEKGTVPSCAAVAQNWDRPGRLATEGTRPLLFESQRVEATGPRTAYFFFGERFAFLAGFL